MCSRTYGVYALTQVQKCKFTLGLLGLVDFFETDDIYSHR
jgi:hypothetical protein